MSDLIDQAQAALLRGVSRQAINDLVRRRKLKSYLRYGRRLVSKKEVLAYKAEAGGRPSPKTKKKEKV